MSGGSRAESNSPLAGCRNFHIPEDVATFTVDKLVKAGRNKDEGFVVWGATIDGDTVNLHSAIEPQQKATKTPRGLLVEVSGEALFDINRTLYKEGQILARQVHRPPH